MAKHPARVSPDLELIVAKPRESFRWNVHCYPHDLAKWHYHPEYELHLIQRSSGTMFVGDHVGGFEPGVVVLTGPNLPHNWVSDIATGEEIADRDMLVQFSDGFMRDAMGVCPELLSIAPLLDAARYGVVFHGATATRAARDLARIGTLTATPRLVLFFKLLDALSRSRERRLLSSQDYAPSLNQSASEAISLVTDFLMDHLTDDIHLTDVARLCGMTESVFSRYFKRHTGHGFVRYLNRTRINRACDLLIQTDRPVTDICFETGFNNVSSFNRQFRSFCGMNPSDYRREAIRNAKPSTQLYKPARAGDAAAASCG